MQISEKSTPKNVRHASFLKYPAAMLSCLLLVFCLSANTAEAQVEPQLEAKNAVYIEIGGNGLLYTLNYDYRLNPDWAARAGIMYASGDGVSLTLVPLTANYLYGTKHNLEIGAGITYFAVSASGDDEFMGIGASTVAFTTNVGYRYQSLDGGFVFRAGIAPIFTEFGTFPMPGVSFGYGF